jgi:NADH dehydrogenase
MMQKPKRIVIIGAGFAGLKAARELAKYVVDIILIDRNNYHTFTPLLYQVATCGLDPSAVAYPIRTIFVNNPNVRFLLGNAAQIDYEKQFVIVQTNTNGERQEYYDYLFIAAGSKTNYFNNLHIERNSFGLRDLDDALTLRNHILRLFEKAAWTEDDNKRDALMTLVVVGGGATGLETAGALYELYNDVLDKEYDKNDNMQVRVILLEAADKLLLPYPDSLRNSAKKQLESLGVEVKTGVFVDEVGSDYIKLKNGDVIHTHTVVWATGVIANPLAQFLDVELATGGRIPTEPTMKVIGRENIFAAGDIAYLLQPDSEKPYPGLIPVAQQQAVLVAKNILHDMKGETLETFNYYDKGTMATIGRRRAVAWVYNRIQMSGYLAWVAWLFLHLIELLGMRNRAQVFLNWVWDYIFYDRSVRIIVEGEKQKRAEDVSKKVVV